MKIHYDKKDQIGPCRLYRRAYCCIEVVIRLKLLFLNRTVR